MYRRIDLDLSRPIRGVGALEALVRYVLGTNSKNETDWLEWKTGLDLASASGRFAVAKQVLGFANRDPSRALSAGGCGYVVLGAEPQNLTGQVGIDPADLVAGLRRYLGDDGPAWSPLWVDVDDTEVLIILVEPPHAGDRSYTLEREFDGFRDGTVFIRRAGGTHQASSAEHRMLEGRLLARPGAPQLALELAVLTEAISPLDLSQTAFEKWLAEERLALLAPLEAERQRKLAPPGPRSINLDEYQSDATRSLAEISSMLSASALGGFGSKPEARSEEEYEQEVATYIGDCEKRLPNAARREYFDQRIAVLRLAIENTTIKNMPQVEVHTTLEGDVFSYSSAPKGSLPRRPTPWGPQKLSLLGNFDYDLARIASISGPEVGWSEPPFTTDNHGSTTIRYRPVDVRPSYTVPLPDVRLVVLAHGASEITGSWYATSTGLDGVAEGTISVPLTDPITWATLCNAQDEDVDFDDG